LKENSLIWKIEDSLIFNIFKKQAFWPAFLF